MKNSNKMIVEVLLSKCQKILYGNLNVILPDNNSYDFRGIFNGPSASIKLNNLIILEALIEKGNVAFGEGYINGLWDTPSLSNLLTLLALNEEVFSEYFYGNIIYKFFYKLKHKSRSNTKLGSVRNIKEHYDLSNDFYELWLDESLTYSCALYNGNNNLTLEEAQIAKFERIYNKLGIIPNTNTLDIGCGWGGLDFYLASKETNVVAVTVSEAQAKYINYKIEQRNLHKRITLELQDYRNISGIYDHIISIGMFEHVGIEYWEFYFKTILDHLKKGGKALVQTITTDEKFFRLKDKNITNFLQNYIFPGSFLPSHTIFLEKAKESGLKCLESFAFGNDYAITLQNWLIRFENNLNKIQKLGFDKKFIKRWQFYLSYAIAGFLSKRINVVQFLLEHN